MRWMFETYAAGATLRSLAKSLEQRGVRARFGKACRPTNPRHDEKSGLRKHVVFRPRTEVTEEPQRSGAESCAIARRGSARRAAALRTELFDRVQERLTKNLQRSLQPAAHSRSRASSSAASAARHFGLPAIRKKELVTGVKRVSHKAATSATGASVSSNTRRSLSSAAGTPRWRRTSWKARCSR